MADWNPQLYTRFEDERTRPARDLLMAVPLSDARRVFDLGCGPGNSTELLAARYPGARLTGMDSSPAMLESARERLPQAEFVAADLRDWAPPEPADVLFSNAVFQWVPDHAAVLARLAQTLAPGGVLAVQMPDNLGEPSHVAMREAAMDGPWRSKLEGALGARQVLPPPGDYYDLLRPLCTRVDIWRTAYQHPLAGLPAIVEWLKSTGLRPFLEPLDEAEREAFLDNYRSRLAFHYPARVDGTVLLAFPRLFIVAQR